MLWSVFFNLSTLGYLMAIILGVLFTIQTQSGYQCIQLGNYRVQGYFRRLHKLDYLYIPLLYIQAVLVALCGILMRILSGYEVVSLCVSIPIVSIFTAIGFYRVHHAKLKTPLRVTARVIRNLILAMVLLSVAVYFMGEFSYFLPTILWGIPLITGMLLQGFEWLNNARYWRSAVKRLKSRPNLIRIGITGSGGKTGVKDILYSMLSEKYRVVKTPKSFNTPLGIIRTIRTDLREDTEIFIVEMGARRVGDIATLCKLIQPSIGVLTSISAQHLSTFHTLSRIISTKFELVDHIQSTGFCVVNGDNEFIATRCEQGQQCQCYLVSAKDQGGSFYVKDIVFGSFGLRFTLFYKGLSFDCATKLLGQFALMNILLATYVALMLGMEMSVLQRVISTLKPTPHRLELIEGKGGVTVIDDSYNANPLGAIQALETLSYFEGQRVVVTPGLVELGESQSEENRKLGEKAAQCADVLVFVGDNGKAMREGAQQVVGIKRHILMVASLNEGMQRLQGILKSGDTVLFLNDLPDGL